MGVVSLFADMTYEGAHSIIGPYLKDLGASATQVGLIAGFGELIAATLRLVSGKLADKTRAYWTITFLGYALNLTVVPGLAFARTGKAPLFVAPNAGARVCAAPQKMCVVPGATKTGTVGVRPASGVVNGRVLGPMFWRDRRARKSLGRHFWVSLAGSGCVHFAVRRAHLRRKSRAEQS